MNLTEYAAKLLREFESRVLSSGPPVGNPHREAQKYYFPCCNTVGASWHRHDYRHCECGKSMIDGGSSYIRCTPGVMPISKCKCGLMPWVDLFEREGGCSILCHQCGPEVGIWCTKKTPNEIIEIWNSSVDSTP